MFDLLNPNERQVGYFDSVNYGDTIVLSDESGHVYIEQDEDVICLDRKDIISLIKILQDVENANSNK